MDYLDDYQYTDFNYTYEGNLSTTEATLFSHKMVCLKETLCLTLFVVSVAIFLLGFCGNAMVIWISGFKMKRTVNTTWYLSLAVSDFVFCAFLPLSITYTVMEDWIFGQFLCKFAPCVMFINMFSSIFILVVISVDRLVSVAFPVWAQNNRTIKKSFIIVVLAWLLAIALSVPSVVYRDTRTHMGRTICLNNYTSNRYSHKIIALSRLLAGFIVPFLIIVICYSIISFKLLNQRMSKSSKPFKVMTALVTAFFLCWLPYHIFILLELNHQDYDSTLLTIGLKLGTSVAAANSFLNPLLYVFMGKDFKQKFRSSLLSKMENAMADEGRTLSRYMSSSMDGRASTHI